MPAESNPLSASLVDTLYALRIALLDVDAFRAERDSLRQLLHAALDLIADLNKKLDDERRRNSRLIIRRRDERLQRVQRRRQARALEESTAA